MLTRAQLDAAVAYNARRGRGDERDHAILVAGFQQAHGLEVDGQLGPVTAAKVAELRAAALAPAAPPVVVVATPPASWPDFDGPLTRRPITYADLVEVYGNPAGADGLASKAWEREHLISRGPDDPLPGMYTTGPGRYVTVHRLAMPYLEEGLRRAREACPTYQLRKLGGHNFRRMRHDTPAKAKAEGRPLRRLSVHAFGGAVDADPDQNRAIDFGAKGERAPLPWTPAWRALYPDGLPQPWVEAMESVGWRWGGRWRLFCDPMHFELAGAGDLEL